MAAAGAAFRGSRSRDRRRRGARDRRRVPLGRHHRRLPRQFLQRHLDRARSGAVGGALRRAWRGLQDRRVWQRPPAAASRRQTRRRASRLRYENHAGASRHRRCRLAATRDAEGNPSAIGVPSAPLAAGNRFTIAGIGVTERGNGKSAGVVRSAELVATGHPGTLQIRLFDPATNGASAKGSAPAPAIPAGRCSSSSRAGRS